MLFIAGNYLNFFANVNYMKTQRHNVTRQNSNPLVTGVATGLFAGALAGPVAALIGSLVGAFAGFFFDNPQRLTRLLRSSKKDRN
ncbi:hypothetical protein [Dyadobacter sandarakinus]|uniref:Glycine zipper domain-containing protein n=1 Tax=Dyadobacter sandarakinus TaxID=2747268 RepID=A0ABX7I8R8_9BACT|nr:hypothetical protein [Dyadobacter sandarakinus]QRR02507.1 hypothetical protein HWI92_17120 [Dyadobacter sandarakinus]